MKRWIALVLTVCFLLNPLGVFAQTAVSTEVLIADLLMQVIGQLSSPSFAAELQGGGNSLALQLALDDAGYPDLQIRAEANGERVQYDADTDGLRMDDGEAQIGVTLETLLRAMLTDENGAQLLPNVTRADAALFEQMAVFFYHQLSAAVTIETETDAAQENAQSIKTEIDVKKLLAALDDAVPAALEQYAEPLDALLARNQQWMEQRFGGSLHSAAQLADAWKTLNLFGLLPIEKPLLLTLVLNHGEKDSVLAQLQYANQPLVRAQYDSQRLWVQAETPGGRTLVFDSRDLTIAAGLLSQAMQHISEQAMCFVQEERETSAYLRIELDMARMVQDFMEGLSYALRINRQSVDMLLARYAPWLEVLFGIPQENLTWMALTEAVETERQYMLADPLYHLSASLGLYHWYLNFNRLFGSNNLSLSLEAMLPSRLNSTAAGYIRMQAGSLSLDMVLNGRTLGCTLTHTDARRYREMRYELTGSLYEDSAQLLYTHYSNQRLYNSLSLLAQREEDGWRAQLMDGDHEELATLHITNDRAQLQIDDFSAELTRQGAGLLLRGGTPDESFKIEWINSPDFLGLIFFLDGTTIKWQVTRSDDRVSAELSLRENSIYDNVLRFEGRARAFSLTAGTEVSGQLTSGIEISADWEMIPRLFAKYLNHYTETSLAYLPGSLTLSSTQLMVNDSMVLQLTDITAPQTDGNETYITFRERRFPAHQSDTQDLAWTVSTRVIGDRYDVTIADHQGSGASLMLDFAAKAPQQDLTHYTWLTPEQVHGMMVELMATPTPPPRPRLQRRPRPARFPRLPRHQPRRLRPRPEPRRRRACTQPCRSRTSVCPIRATTPM